jgi:redox-sensing transcriptional repressor
MGNLGLALANYAGFRERGFVVAALVDTDSRKVGTEVNELSVRHLDDLPEMVRERGITIGVIATPATAAQEVAAKMVAAGITSILNFAPTVISVPEEVSVRKVDLAVELQILSFYNERRSALEAKR